MLIHETNSGYAYVNDTSKNELSQLDQCRSNILEKEIEYLINLRIILKSICVKPAVILT